MSERQRVAIVIADPYPIFRDGLRRLLETDPRFVIVGESNGGKTAVTVTRETAPDLLLFGMTRRVPHALDTLRELQEAGLPTRTIVLVDRVDTPEVRSALQFRIHAVVPKDSKPDTLLATIQAVMAGDVCDGADRVQLATSQWRRLAEARRRSRAFGLTRRELEILSAVLAGCTNREIAERASITENTVKTHLAHLFDKVGASNRVELALFAAHHRVLDGS